MQQASFLSDVSLLIHSKFLYLGPAFSFAGFFYHPVPVPHIPSPSPSALYLTTLQMPAMVAGGASHGIGSFLVDLNPPREAEFTGIHKIIQITRIA